MPDIKEKLIELLADSPGLATLTGKLEEYAENADWLIANGVTVQDGEDNNVPTKWISVKDRLPKLCAEEPEWTEAVLFRTITGRIYSGFRNQGRPQTSFYDDDWYPPYWMDESEQIEVEDEYVTHWMPLPEPPKGE